ncbi:MAG: S-layer homology domain-containing protein [Acidimicrobiia bacterium]
MLPTLLAALLALPLVLVGPPLPASAAVSRGSFENCLLGSVNAERTARGIAPVEMAEEMVDDVRDWSEWMRFNTFEHMSGSLRLSILPDTWTTYGENIAWSSNSGLSDCSTIHEMWMNSSGHRTNILDPSFHHLAVGTYVDGSGWWATQLFFDATNYPVTCEGTFCDDDGATFEPAIEKVAAAGFTQGCNPPTNDRFCPDDRVTRGEMAAFLTRAMGLPSGPSPDFTDDNGSVFEDSIERIAAAGITQGCNPPDNTRFCPDAPMTRGQMAAFLTRAFDLPSAHGIDFTDDDRSMFEEAIQSLAAAGITYGCNPPNNTRFCPDDYVTRGQMAAFLARAFGL